MSSSNLNQLSGKAFVLGDNINTDLHCSSKYLPGKDALYVSKIAFEQASPGFANRVHELAGGILVAGENFGINSSREQATHILLLMNIRVILAKSFGRQFFRNAINNGIAVLECDTSQILEGEDLAIDFYAGTVGSSSGLRLQAKPLPREIMKIVELGGLIPFLQKHPDWSFPA